MGTEMETQKVMQMEMEAEDLAATGRRWTMKMGMEMQMEKVMEMEMEAKNFAATGRG